MIFDYFDFSIRPTADAELLEPMGWVVFILFLRVHQAEGIGRIDTVFW